MKFIQKNLYIIIVIFLAVGFFSATSFYNYTIQKEGFYKWLAPDENANYVFAKLYAQEGQMQIFEKYNLYVDDIMHPRSFRSDYGNIKPVSFLGIILIYGFLASIFSFKIIPFLTPFFASIGIVFFYLFVKEIFGKKNALVSAFLMAVFPAFIYYSARSMFHNVLFVSLLIISAFFCLKMGTRPEMKNEKNIFAKTDWLGLVYSAIAGSFLGLAIITRASELLWLGPIFFIAWLFNIRKIGVSKLLIFLSFVFLAILPTLYWNQILYSSPIKGGYNEMNQSIEIVTESSVEAVKSTAQGQLSYARDFLSKIKRAVFYFGFNPERSWQSFNNYFIKMFAFIFWPACLGLILFFQNFYKWKKKHLVYFLSLCLSGFILVLYYGSWQFYDNPDKTRQTIGNSYTRYWLPFYFLTLPLVSMFIIRFAKALFNFEKKEIKTNDILEDSEKRLPLFYNFKKCRKKFFIVSAEIVMVSIISFVSINFVLVGSEEGLVYNISKMDESKKEVEQIMELTESNSVIVTRYHDKLLFPERKVIVGLFDNKEIIKRYAIITEYLPVYYYNFNLGEEDIKYLNERRLGEQGIQIEKVKQITKDFTLYRLFLIQKLEAGSR